MSIKTHILQLHCWLFVLCTLLLIASKLDAQYYHATSYDQQDGLNSQFVWDINQDDKGQMWFLTHTGLAIYDGFTWQSLEETEQGYLLPSSRMSRIFKTEQGNFWLVGANYKEQLAVLQLDKSTQQWQPFANDIVIKHKVYFSAMTEAESKTQLIIGAVNEVFYTKNVGEEWHTLELDPKMGNLLNVDFIDNIPHIFTKKGIYKLLENRFIKQTYEFEQLANYPRLGPIVAIKKELSGELALIGEKAIGKTLGKYLDIVLEVDEKDLFSYSYKSVQTEINPAYDFITLFNSRLYGRFYDTRYTPIYSKGDGEFTWANRFFLDRQNILWVATDRGVKKFTNFTFESYNKQSGLQDFEVTSIKAFDNGKMFLGSNNGWQLFKNDELSNFILNKVTNQELNYRVQSTAVYNNKMYVAATKSGLIEINEKQQTRLLVDKNVHAVTVYNNAVHFMDVNNRLYRLDENDRVHLVKDLGALFHKYFRMLYVGADQQLYAYGELGVINVETNAIIFGQQLLPNVRDYSTYSFVDLDDDFFAVGTIEGVHLLDKQTFEVVPHWNGINHPSYALLKSKDGQRVYVGTDRGLYVIHESGTKNLYTTNDGLLGNEVNRDALFESADGKIWIGTNKGLNGLSTDRLVERVKPPLVGVYSLYNLTEETELLNAENGKVNPGNSVAIRFYISGFYDEEQIEIRYRLNNNDDWIYEKGNLNGEKFFYSLSNGTYTFQIQAREEQSDWSDIAYSSTFKVMPPIYQRFWFLMLISVVVATVVFIGLRFLNLKRREQQLNHELDIRTKKLLDQQIRLEQQNKELLESNKSLDQFTSAVSHDLKSPLNSSIGLLELLDESYSQEELLHFTGMVINNLKKMKNFISELIELSRNANQGVKFEALDLKKMILDVYDLFDQTPVQKSVDKRLLINGDAPFLGDKSRLNVVFSNLISNAINYHNPSAENPFCDIRIDVLEDDVFITVRDNGKGIPKRFQDKIFDMFFRVETSVSGTGLGLFLVKEVIDKMGGTIKVNSEEGMGTTFYIILPNGSPLSKRAKSASSNLPSKSDKPISIDFNDEKFSSKT